MHDATELGLREWSFSDTGRTRPVYSLDEPGAPPVVLLHELPGLSPECLRFGRDLAAAGFSVHMPLLFGEFGQASTVKGTYQMWCLRKEFELFRNNRTSDISSWIRALCESLAADDATVGVVGMCATGGLIMSVMYSRSVGAAVAAQPSLPFRLYTRASIENLGATRSDVEASARSATPLMTLRFENDPICPANRGRAMAATFTTAEFLQHTAPGKRHATLTVHADQADGAVAKTLDFLQRNLLADRTEAE